MMKSIAALALVGSAAAFAPAPVQQKSTALYENPLANELGAQAPLGFFDPLGACADGDKENFDRLRWVELKHGRISMLAVGKFPITYLDLCRT